MTKNPDLDPVTQWLNTASLKPQLPKETIHQIARQIQALPEDSPKRVKLVNKLVEHNLLLVATFVHRSMRSHGSRPWGHECTVDVLQAGTLGLKRAAELFDPTRGYQFSTYASNWIKCYANKQRYRELSPIYIPEDSIRSAYRYAEDGESGTSRSFSVKNAYFLTSQILGAINSLSLDKLTGDDIDLLDSLSKDYTIESSEPCVFTAEGEAGFTDEIEILLRKAKIPEDSIRFLRLKFINNLSYREISDLDGTPMTLVRSRVDSAMNKLRKSYRPDKLAL